MYFILTPGKLLSECSELLNLTEFLICVFTLPVHIVLLYRTVPVGLCCGWINCKCCEYRCMEVSSWESRILNQYSPGLNHSNLRIQCYSQTMKLNACYCVYSRLYTLYIIIYIYMQFVFDSPLQASILLMFVCLGFPRESWEFLQPKHNKLVRNTVSA